MTAVRASAQSADRLRSCDFSTSIYHVSQSALLIFILVAAVGQSRSPVLYIPQL